MPAPPPHVGDRSLGRGAPAHAHAHGPALHSGGGQLGAGSATDGPGSDAASEAIPAPVTTPISLAEIEANPAGFSADSHTADFAAGVVRGQLTAIPVGGVDTGAGGTAAASSSTGLVTGVAVGGLVFAAAAGVVVWRRRTTTS
ncbi:hypothetical protein [Microbacterium aurantiacum]|uniref:hypothetical protein n=1 Tax=Microbacterium aurantiacum TaxID=162393 RepID=UPI001F4345A7|nr:hypothetical protein [Microbacterium aurantiacum]